MENKEGGRGQERRPLNLAPRALIGMDVPDVRVLQVNRKYEFISLKIKFSTFLRI